ncbi:MAG: hypothetical protein AB8I08_16620 [Sandaracinaceae bacterium]
MNTVETKSDGPSNTAPTMPDSGGRALGNPILGAFDVPLAGNHLRAVARWLVRRTLFELGQSLVVLGVSLQRLLLELWFPLLLEWLVFELRLPRLLVAIEFLRGILSPDRAVGTDAVAT